MPQSEVVRWRCTTVDRRMKYKVIIYEVAVRKYGSNYPHFHAFSMVVN